MKDKTKKVFGEIVEAAIGVGLICVSTFIIYKVGYAIGYKQGCINSNNGVDAILAEDPELKKQFTEAVGKVFMKQLEK